MFGLIKKVLDKYRDNFEEGGKLEKFYPIFEATDTILFSTNEVTKSGPHIRDSIDTKRIMILVVITLLPLYIFGAINIGFQNSIAIDLERSNWENFWFGFNKILPIIIVTFASGAFWELLFAVVRKHPVSEGFLVTCALIPLTMPAGIPLWQIAVATTFGIVIGKETKNISEKEAANHIIGYCLVNDLSEREWQIEKLGQWIKGKSHDTFGPIGPYLVTPEEISDINNLNLTLDVNGQRMQTGNTNKMIFNVYYIVSYLSKFMSLQPGDIITTGTPPGVGMGKKPQVFLKNGDTLRLSVDNLGEQNSKVVLI